VTVNQSVSGSALAAHQVLAAEEHSAGGLGLLILVGLLAASAFLFVLLSRSMRRMRANVASGQFLGVDSDRLHEPIDPRQALRRRSAYLGGKAPWTCLSSPDRRPAADSSPGARAEIAHRASRIAPRDNDA
jgi:hypothetical protein